MILFYSQIKDILNRDIKFSLKFILLKITVMNLIKTNILKFVYRFLSSIFLGKFDDNIYKLILKIIPDNKDIDQIVDKKLYKDFYPKHYPYKKVN